MNLQEAVLPRSSPQLPHCFDEWRTFDIPDCATQLNYAHVWCLIRVIDRNLGNPLDPILNRVCEMRDGLHRPGKIIALPLSFNNMLIDLSSRDVVFACQGDVEVPSVVFEVKIYLTATILCRNNIWET